ncbi:NAD(P)-dependent oxidoreductase [Rhizobium panacihumi]|uniref:NAD(P)-dependent oxidoreductase n=1 Tax=Rhizobium panacihumi TaxID=2008450 RepID=UPI003D7B77AC
MHASRCPRFVLSLEASHFLEVGMAKVAFIGLGVMGYPMAGHLRQKGGHEVTVYNRTAAKAEDWAKKFGGKTGATPAEAAKDADFVFTCVGNDDDLRSVTLGETGVLAGMKPGAILIDNTTASADVARELAMAATEKNIGFIDAPVSGGQAGAENGVLTVMCGGDQATFDEAKPVIDAFARMVGLMGPVGSGQLTKMMNQICIAGIVQGLAESIHFGKQAGLDIEKVVDVISKGAAGSWQMEARHKTMNEGKYDFGFAVDWMRKDLGIVLEEARNNGAKLPLTALVDQFYGDVQAMGGNRWDTSSLLARLDRK